LLCFGAFLPGVFPSLRINLFLVTGGIPVGVSTFAPLILLLNLDPVVGTDLVASNLRLRFSSFFSVETRGSNREGVEGFLFGVTPEIGVWKTSSGVEGRVGSVDI